MAQHRQARPVLHRILVSAVVQYLIIVLYYIRKWTCFRFGHDVLERNVKKGTSCSLTLLHSERPKLYTILAFLSAIGYIFKCVGTHPCVSVSFTKGNNSEFSVLLQWTIYPF